MNAHGHSPHRRIPVSVLTGQPADRPGLVWAAAESDWTAIHRLDVSLAIQPRTLPDFASEAEWVLRDAPFERIGAGPVDSACKALGRLPGALGRDVAMLASRFSRLMDADQVRIRLEGITSNACRKIHADYTDLRLITTYAGSGTQVLRHGAEAVEENLWPMRPGWIGLFKGRLFEEGHSACLHRSPPAGDLGEKRLVLVIDTPQFSAEGLVA